MTHPAAVAPVRHMRPVALGALLLLGLVAHPAGAYRSTAPSASVHAPGPLLAGDGTKTGTGGG